MPSRKKNANHYLVMWDMLGLECIFNVSKHLKEVEDHGKKVMWNLLKDPDFKDIGPPKLPLNMMIMRARFNTQRSYEIYEFNSIMSESELRKEFACDPQPIVEWIRENGHRVYSDYVKSDRKMIV